MMTKKLLSLVTAVLLLHAAGALSFRASAQGEERAAKVKAKVARRGVGEKARVTVKLQGGEKLKGYVSQAGEDSFTLTEKNGQTRTLAYRDVAEVNKPGGLSLGAKVGIGAAIVVGTLGLVYAVGCHDDPIC